jgi:hypothetical protein
MSARLRQTALTGGAPTKEDAMSAGVARCDQILALIDACLAQADAASPGSTVTIGHPVGGRASGHSDEARRRLTAPPGDARRAAATRRHRRHPEVLGVTTILAPIGCAEPPHAA